MIAKLADEILNACIRLGRDEFGPGLERISTTGISIQRPAGNVIHRTDDNARKGCSVFPARSLERVIAIERYANSNPIRV